MTIHANDLSTTNFGFVRSLNRPHADDQLAEALDCYKADITAIQEMRWDGPGQRKMNNCDIYYGESYREQNQRLFGCGFVVGTRFRRKVLRFNSVNEGITTIRIKAKFTNVSLISALAPMCGKDTKDSS